MLHLNYMDLPEGKSLRVQNASGITIVKSRYDALVTLSYLGHAKKLVEDYLSRGAENEEKGTKGFPTVEFAFTPIGVQMKSNVSLLETKKLICDAIEEVKKAFR